MHAEGLEVWGLEFGVWGLGFEGLGLGVGHNSCLIAHLGIDQCTHRSRTVHTKACIARNGAVSQLALRFRQDCTALPGLAAEGYSVLGVVAACCIGSLGCRV